MLERRRRLAGVFVERGDGEEVMFEELEEAVGFAAEEEFVRNGGVSDGEKRGGGRRVWV